MPLIRCRWYTEEGSPIGDGCRALRYGDCDFVHPSHPNWARARPSRPPYGQDSSGGRRDDAGWSGRGRDSGWDRGRDRRTSNRSARDPKGFEDASHKDSWGSNDAGGWGSSSSWGASASTSASTTWNTTDSWGKSTSTDTNDTWGAGSSTSAPRAPKNHPSSSTNASRSAFVSAAPRESSAVSAWGTAGGSSGGWGKPVESTGSDWGNTSGSNGGWGTTIEASSGWGNTLESNSGWGKTLDTTSSWGNIVESTSSWGQTVEPSGGSDATASGKQRTVAEPKPAISAPKATNDITHAADASTSSNTWGAASPPPASGWDSGSSAAGAWGMDNTNATDPASAPRPAAASSSGHVANVASSSWLPVSTPVSSEPWPRTGPAVESDWPMVDDSSPSKDVAEAKADLRPAGDKSRDLDEPQERALSLKSRSRTSSRRSSPMHSTRRPPSRPASPELPDGPVKAVKALSKAVLTYVEWEQAKDALSRSKSLYKSPQYARAGPAAREKVKQEYVRCGEECESVQQRRDDALQALKSIWPSFGPVGRSETTEASAADPIVEEFQRYSTEINTWLEQVRPLVEPPSLQRPSASTMQDVRMSVESTRPSRRAVDAQTFEFLREAMDRIEKMDVKVKELEDYQEGLGRDANDAFSRVDTVTGPFPHPLPVPAVTVPPERVQKTETEISALQSDLKFVHSEVSELSNRKQTSRLELQRLRTEQEGLKLRVLELEESQNDVRRNVDQVAGALSELKSKLAKLQEKPRDPPLPPPAPMPEPNLSTEDILAMIEPQLRQAFREDLMMGLEQLRAGFQDAAAEQTKQLCNAVWQELHPVLAIVRLINKNVVTESGDSDVETALGHIHSAYPGQG